MRCSITCRAGSKPRSGTSVGKFAQGRRRDQSDDLAGHRPGAVGGGEPADLLDHDPERDRDRVVDVGRDLCRATEVDADGAHTAEPATGLAQLRRDRARDVDVARYRARR